MSYLLRKSTRKDKKWMIITPTEKKIHFGAIGYLDYTMHKDSTRKAKYISRHQAKEDWSIHGINTPGFWAYWLLWNEPTLNASIADVERRFNINIGF